MKTCPKCKTSKDDSEFYRRRKGKNLSAYCKPCTKWQTVSRQRDFKVKCVEYKGGVCEDCGLVDHPVVYDFHHLDPTQKDFAISKVKLTSFDERTTVELDKCALLCSNCHRKRHWIEYA